MPIPAACLADDDAGNRPLHLLMKDEVQGWLDARPERERRWLDATGFKAEPGAVRVLPGEDGGAAAAFAVLSERPCLWDVAAARDALPPGAAWRIEDPAKRVDPAEAALGWRLAAYRFDRYRKDAGEGPSLAVDADARRRAEGLSDAIALGRDLVNTPAGDLGPEALCAAIAEAAEALGARTKSVVGDALLAEDWPAIHAVGRAGPEAPRLLDVAWGEKDAPKLTLVGKGVCFDTGGLDIKPASGMLLMKKDMGGAAAMAALALAVIRAGLPVRLRLLVPAVENSISATSFRPGDVVRTRKGLTIEVGNTDAEGRVILADALHEAASENPDLILDAATLTGAARVALGPELPVLFAPQDGVAGGILEAGEAAFEPLWRLPLHQPYRAYIKSRIADLNNAGAKPFAGAITAALFLQSFAGEGDWAHLDLFGWNDEARPGRPKGGEAMAVRPLLAYLKGRYAR
ncbi:MAG: leucyl aminopeptidase family protein [Geminicoccaceae bacterium]|nr:leucyl aminopeptidase family protein [Geminicoccaceae bacterium]